MNAKGLQITQELSKLDLLRQYEFTINRQENEIRLVSHSFEHKK